MLRAACSQNVLKHWVLHAGYMYCTTSIEVLRAACLRYHRPHILKLQMWVPTANRSGDMLKKIFFLCIFVKTAYFWLLDSASGHDILWFHSDLMFRLRPNSILLEWISFTGFWCVARTATRSHTGRGVYFMEGYMYTILTVNVQCF